MAVQIGDRFGRLTVKELVRIPRKDKPNHSRAAAICRCDCGVITKPIDVGNLRKGASKSCGCYSKECFLARFTKHGQSVDRGKTPTYSTWTEMKKRCRPSYKRAKDYHGRDIDVCDRWLESYENFLEDMGEKPGHEYSLDRIDNDRGYEPGNCRWATQKQQQRNRRDNHTITLPDGRAVTLAEASEIHGISKYTLCDRLRRGWSVEKSLTTPVRKTSQAYRSKSHQKEVF